MTPTERAARAICAHLNARDFAKEAPTLEAFVETAWASYLGAARLAIEAVRPALQAAKTEIEFWVDEHGCCAGHEEATLAMIDEALK